MNKRTIGSKQEQLAAQYLSEHGYEIIESNYFCKAGEIDLIGRDEEYLCFIEVKYRSDLSDGHPLEAVDMKKAARISRSALFYLNHHGYDMGTPCRFDVISILGDEVTLVKNAFDFT